jgi:hypothetical protein
MPTTRTNQAPSATRMARRTRLHATRHDARAPLNILTALKHFYGSFLASASKYWLRGGSCVLPGIVAWLRGNQAQRRALRTMLRHSACLLSLILLDSLPGVDFVLLRVMQLFSSLFEYVGAVYARRHEFLCTNGSLAAQPLHLTVPGSCLY